MDAAAVRTPLDSPHVNESAQSVPLHARLLAWADRQRYWLLILIPALYFAAFNGQWRVSPDSALYASLGRNLAEGKGYTYQGERHTWVEPGFPWLISKGFQLAGPEQFWPTLLVLTGLALLALWLFYRLMKLHVGRPAAVVLTGMLALNETFFRYPYHLFTDTPFLVGVLVFLLGYERLLFLSPLPVLRERVRVRVPSAPDGNAPSPQPSPGVPGEGVEASSNRNGLGKVATLLLIALGTFMMTATRPAIWTFLGALLAATLWHIFRGPRRSRHVLILVVAVAAVFAYRAVDPRFQKDPITGARPVQKTSVVEGRVKDLVLHRPGLMIKRTITETVPLMFEETAVEAIYGSRIAPGVNTVLTVITIGLGILLMRERPLWGLLVGATFAQMLIHLPRERYFLPVLPLLVYALWRVAVCLELRLNGARGRGAFVAVMLLVVGINAGVIAGDIHEQHQKPFLAYYDHGKYEPLIRLAREMESVVGERDVVIAQEDRILSYYSRRKTLPPITARRWAPPEAEVNAFRDELSAAEHLFVLLPGEKVEQLVREWRIEVEPSPVVSASGPLTKGPKKEVHYALYRAKLPTTRPAAVP
jgi:hypothetical protein